MTTPTTQRVTTRVLSWREIVEKLDGKDRMKPDVAYEFSGGRKFDSNDRNGGPYGELDVSED